MKPTRPDPGFKIGERVESRETGERGTVVFSANDTWPVAYYWRVDVAWDDQPRTGVFWSTLRHVSAVDQLADVIKETSSRRPTDKMRVS